MKRDVAPSRRKAVKAAPAVWSEAMERESSERSALRPPTRRSARIRSKKMSSGQSRTCGLERSDGKRIQRTFRAEAAHAPKRAHQEQEDVKRSKPHLRFGAKRWKENPANVPRSGRPRAEARASGARRCKAVKAAPAVWSEAMKLKTLLRPHWPWVPHAAARGSGKNLADARAVARFGCAACTRAAWQ